MKINSRVYYVLLAHPTEYKRRERNKEKKTLRIKETLCTLAKDERNARTKKNNQTNAMANQPKCEKEHFSFNRERRRTKKTKLATYVRKISLLHSVLCYIDNHTVALAIARVKMHISV